MVVRLSDGKEHFLKALPLTLLSSAILAAGQYYLAVNDLWLIAVTLPAMMGLGFGFLYMRFFSSYSRGYLDKMKKKDRQAILTALLPYLVLVVMIFIFNFFTPLRELLGPYALGFEFPELRTTFGFITPAETGKKINLFLHPGTIIILSGLLMFVFLKRRGYLKGVALDRIIKDSFNNSRNTSIAIFSLVGTAVVMNHAQMTNLLAEGISSAISREIYPIMAPFIGALGAFITGSNNNSNVLFGSLQMQTALLLDLPVALILAAQTAGGALGSIMAPAKVILGCSTVGLGGKEGEVIGKLVLYTSGLILSMGILAFIILKMT
jgi:lactate permease